MPGMRFTTCVVLKQMCNKDTQPACPEEARHFPGVFVTASACVYLLNHLNRKISYRKSVGWSNVISFYINCDSTTHACIYVCVDTEIDILTASKTSIIYIWTTLKIHKCVCILIYEYWNRSINITILLYSVVILMTSFSITFIKRIYLIWNDNIVWLLLSTLLEGLHNVNKTTL